MPSFFLANGHYDINSIHYAFNYPRLEKTITRMDPHCLSTSSDFKLITTITRYNLNKDAVHSQTELLF